MIGQISEALFSRFLCGMVVGLTLPDFETRCRILRSRWVALGLAACQDGSGNGNGNGSAVAGELPDEVVAYVAERVRHNVRELEGALYRLAAHRGAEGGSLDLDLARRALDEHLRQTEKLLTVEQIEAAVATYFGVTVADLRSSRKTRSIALARAVAMFLARKHTPLSLPEIGRSMGNKDHTTVLLACRRIEKLISCPGPVKWVSPSGPRWASVAPLVRELEDQLAH
jgi:chromosomal replication initiator protein